MKRYGWMSIIMAMVLVVSIEAFAAPPSLPNTPAPVGALVYARPFTLEEGFSSDWRKERPLVTSGYLLVLKVAPALVYPRQVAEPVLYAGEQTAERVNVGYRSGHVIAIAPGEVDLTKVPIWFGTPELPERVDGNRIQSERSMAESAGIRPFGSNAVKAALARGGDRIFVYDRAGLLRHVAVLINQYSQAEKDLAEALLNAAR